MASVSTILERTSRGVPRETGSLRQDRILRGPGTPQAPRKHDRALKRSRVPDPHTRYYISCRRACHHHPAGSHVCNYREVRKTQSMFRCMKVPGGIDGGAWSMSVGCAGPSGDHRAVSPGRTPQNKAEASKARRLLGSRPVRDRASAPRSRGQNFVALHCHPQACAQVKMRPQHVAQAPRDRRMHPGGQILSPSAKEIPWTVAPRLRSCLARPGQGGRRQS